jgi:molybdenum cofactor guanylyltransferase
MSAILNVSAVILAGGQSQRMGRDKALLPIYDTTLLQHTVDIATACTDQVYIVSSPRVGWPIETQWIAEDPPQQGPLLAFQQSLAVVNSEWVLLMACDLPYVQVAVLNRWIAELPLVPPSSIAYLAPHQTARGNGWQCLCGFYRSSSRDNLDRFVAAGGKSFQAWLQQELVTPITNFDPHTFTNWNYPADVVAF